MCPHRAGEIILPVLILSVTAAVLSGETGVTKRAGETVTLYMTDILRPSKNYLWTFGHHNPIIAVTIVTNGELTPVNGTRFENRLHTDVETGSLTISNLTINDSGAFLVQVFTEKGILMQRFNLTVQDNSVISGNVLEGNNITLDTGVEELQKDHTVKWTQGPHFSGKLIAQWKNSKIFIEESFRDVLQLNPHTGSLTIIRGTQSYTGNYCVMMLLGHESHILRQYLVTFFKPVPMPHISMASVNITTHSLNVGNCYLNCVVKNGPNVTISWYRGEKEINRTSNTDISTNLTLPLEIQSQDEGIYRCVAANPVSREAVTVNSTQWCPRDDSKMVLWIIVGSVVGGVVLVILFVLAILFYKRRNNDRQENCFRMRNMGERMSSQCTNIPKGNADSMEEDPLTNS